MKTCVFITGTNAVGKSALAWSIIERFGGVDRITNDVTYCKEGSVCLAGKYGVTRFGGVDSITNDKGSSCTSELARVVEEGLRNADTIICEGSFMNTFGLNLSNALFKAEKQLIISLYADNITLWKRLTERSLGKAGDGKRRFDLIIKKQRQAMIAARRWQSIGVPVIQINTSETPVDEVLRLTLEKLSEICSR